MVHEEQLRPTKIDQIRQKIDKRDDWLVCLVHVAGFVLNCSEKTDSGIPKSRFRFLYFKLVWMGSHERTRKRMRSYQ